MHKMELEPEYTEYPLASYQKDIWLEQCLYSGKPIYNLGGFMAITGQIDKAVLNKSIAILIKRNDSLRMNVVDKKGEPYLRILSEIAYEVPFYDFSNEENPDETCLSWMKEEFSEPLNFEGNLFQFALLKSDDNTYFWFMKFHHIMIDGFGLSMMYKQVIENYNQLMTGATEIERITYSYTDFIADNQKYLHSPVFLSDKEFWKAKYRTIPEPLFNRNTDSNISMDSSIVSDRVTFSIKRPSYNKMIAFSEANGCTVFHLILGVLFTYFSRVCNKEEVVIGVPTLNRGKAKYKQTLGLFANVVPLRINPGKDMDFKELMLTIKGELMECYRHQKFPIGEIYRTAFEQVKEKSNIFDISLSYVNRDFSENYVTASDYDIVSMTHQHERNALTIFVREYNDERDIYIDFDYQIGLFEKFMPIETVIAHFKYLLSEVIENSEQSVFELEIIPKDEKQRILYDFNNTKVEYPKEKTIHELFEEQVHRVADHAAVVFENRQLTYQELNTKANKLAKVLRNKGVKPDRIVGIMLDRSIEMVIGILGVLKAGGAYLPIDPNYPMERITYMLEDSSTGILLTQKHFKEKVSYQGEVIDIEDDGIYKGDNEGLENINKPSDLAYIIYTSGSTGKPKGVMIEHKGMANLKTFFQRNYHVDEKDNMLQFASSSFDASVWEIFTSLLTGATLYMVDHETIHHLADFENFIDKNEITIALLPPTYLAGIDPERVTKLKHLITGGSAITKGLVDKWKERLVYSNAYGPTESTVIATTWKYNELELEYSPVPIGRPISNTEIYILDSNNQLLPIASAGELCIGGDGLARGYLNKPELTAEKFVANPYRNGEKMYKTGDLARWLPDGNIEFLGRIDHQVKIRGFRIELGEIEAELLKHPLVKEAAVIDREDQQGDKSLVAYFVTDDELTIDELREHLLKELPDYMVPSYIIRLDCMPLTSNDKVDRRALPEPDCSKASGGVYIAPRNDKEAILAKVWQEVLKAERVGIRDNFFNLGGDSIKAIQILSRLNAYRLKLEMKDLFKHPVIEELGDFVQTVARRAEQGIIKGKVSLTPIQHWLFEQGFAEKHHFNQAVMLYRQEGFAEEVLRSVFCKLIEHHDALRMVANQEEDEVVLFNRGLEGILYSLEVFDLLQYDDVRDIIEAEANRIQESLELSHGPLVKAGLFKTKTGDQLLIVIHHIAVDGISWRIILQDLFNGYMQALKQEAIQFADKTDSYNAWTVQLSTYANSQELLKEVDYWAEMEGVPVKTLPKDRIITERKYEGSEQVQIEFTTQDTERLLKEVNQGYNTEINDILLTALGLAVKEWTGEDRVLINLEGHGREDIIKEFDISRTVGWFTTQYPVILNMGKKRDLAHRIKSVKEGMRQIPNKGIGYGILKYLTLPQNKRNLQFNLKPEISFNYLGQFEEDADGAFSISDVSVGRCVSLNMEQPYAIDINGMVRQGKLVLNFTYHKAEYDRATIVKFAEGFRGNLIHVAAHCAALDYTEMTPSDFTLKKFTIDELETALHNLDTRNIKDLYKLSPMQEGMLYHAMKDKESSAYLEQAILSIDGRLDIAHLEESFNKLIEGYDILRTVFVYEKLAKPIQVVMKEQKACIDAVDISDLPEVDQELFIETFKIKDKIRGFDLQKGMPIRLSVIQTGTASYKLIWSFHHIIMDGWCLGIILKEFFGMYARLQENRLPELGKVYPYSNYIKWLDDQEHQKAQNYWEGYLRDYEEQVSLSKNSSTLVPGRYEQEELLFSLDEEIRCGLEQIARRSNVTLSTIIQTIWGLLLARYNNTDDVVFGAVVSGRPHELMGVENMVGLFINTLPVRIKFDSNQSLAQLLQEVQLAAIESEGYSYYPLAEIQARTSVENTLFDHIIAFENYPIEEVMNGNYGVDIKATEVFEQTNYDFNMVVIPGKELNIKFMYNSLVYDRRFIGMLKGHIKTMILGVISNPGILVKDIDMLTAEEQKELLDTFNDTNRDYPKDKIISELFEAQVRRTPDNIAVVFEEQKLTYKVLNEKANQLAGVLRRKGVTANNIVGIMAERSPAMMIGLMGILKAGGAYLPIDPEYPVERINYMLADSGSRVLLTQAHLVSKIAFNGDIINLEEEELYQGNAANVVRENTSQDLAYVIYTSGSTGKPKGVEIEHASLVNLVFWHRRVHHITSEDRATLVAGPAFDASVWETWPYLVSGAGLYIPSDEIRVSTTELIKWLHDNLITISFMPTPLAEALLAEVWPREISLRTMLTGGDKLHRRPHLDIPFTLVNHYGPTENTVVATWGRIMSVDSADTLPSIGRPMDNTNVYILDRNDRLQPIGIPGELCISGDGLARGYLNRPDLTAEKFAPNPFKSGVRMYRTGDLVRWLPDGNIEFLGRIDHQVKIRGFRMELGEIENQMLKHKEIKEGVVILREDKQGDKYLAAYVVADRELTANELKIHLSKELPEYMVPLYFTQLDKLPLTPNGKIDRKALPVPDGWGNTGECYIAPRNEADGRIQKVWQDILEINRIGIDDNFFMLGGNSIKAIQVVAKLALDFEIGINDIFQCQTIRNLSDTIKYSKDRLKATIDAMNEVAATKDNSICFDGNLRSKLKEYKIKNQKYEQVGLFEIAQYKNILLAGSTGYLGIHILHQLLKDTDYMVYLPIRGEDDEEAKIRLWGKLEFYFNLNRNDHGNLESRICVFNGDLSKEYLGLDPKKYMELADTIDCIINSAANVKHYGHYSEFHAVNVKGNERLVEFANTGKKKAYNFISTTSVGSGYIDGKASLIFTEYDCDLGQNSDNYYVATKLEAEKFLVKAREEGLKANVFRVGNLVFDSETGVFQENIEDNAFYTLVKSLIKIGHFPEIDEKTLNFSFIDYVAKAVVLLFDKVNLKNETYHLFNTNQISLVSLGELLKYAGMHTKTIPVDDFIKYLYEKYEDEEAKSHIARILVHSNMFFEGASKTSFMIRNEKTENILKELNLKWPELNPTGVRLMMEHCKKVGFI